MKNLNEERLEAGMKLQSFLANDITYANSIGIKSDATGIPLVPYTHYVTAKVTGTTIEFVETKTDDEVGVQSFNGDKLNPNKPFVLCGIAGVYAEETTDAESRATANYTKPAPAKLVNGDLKINQTDRGNLVEIPFVQVFNQNTTNQNLDREFEVADMPVIKDNLSLRVDGKTTGALPAAKDHFVRLELRGYTIKS